MVSIPRNIKYNNIYSGKGITFLMTGATNDNKGYAVSFDSKSHAQNKDGVFVKLADDDDIVIGRLEAVLDSVRSATPSADVMVVSVLTEGLLKFPAVSTSTSASFLPGTYVVGAGDGEVKELTAISAAGSSPMALQFDEDNLEVIAWFK